MTFARNWTRVENYYKRNSARLVFKRPQIIHLQQPLVSFTFDDFPRTALHAGGRILRDHGTFGTYYVSLGLLGRDSPSGPICIEEDLKDLLQQGHELGCHTFSHCHSWNTKSAEFESSILKNCAALQRLIPGAKLRSLSYPISEPRPLTKSRVARYFSCCRAGGQTLNAGTADLNQLSAYFLEQSKGNIQPIKELIDLNQRVGGWLIFATHDVCSAPSPYGCTPEFLEEVVRYAAASGTHMLPVAKALDVIRGIPDEQGEAETEASKDLDKAMLASESN